MLFGVHNFYSLIRELSAGLAFLLIFQFSAAQAQTCNKVYKASKAEPRLEIILGKDQALSDEFAFEVGPDTQSFIIQAEGRQDVDYVITELRGPSKQFEMNSAPYYPKTASAIVVGKNKSLAEGIWRMKIKPMQKLQEDETFQLRFFTVPAQAKKKLTINLVLTGSFGLSKKSFKNSNVAQGLRDLETIFKRSGIDLEISQISDLKLPGKDLTLEQVLELPQAQNKGMNVFVMENVPFEFGEAQGISPGAPGFIGKNPDSGTVVISNFAEPMMRLKPMGLLLAHEIGHYLGLKHPYEPRDPLPTNPDYYDIMSPDSLGGPDLTQYHFTARDLEIIKGHPLLNQSLEH